MFKNVYRNVLNVITNQMIFLLLMSLSLFRRNKIQENQVLSEKSFIFSLSS